MTLELIELLIFKIWGENEAAETPKDVASLAAKCGIASGVSAEVGNADSGNEPLGALQDQSDIPSE